MEKEIIRICGKIFRKETGSIVWIIKLRIGGRLKYEIRQTGKGDNNQSILLSLEELRKVKEIIGIELKKEKEIEKEIEEDAEKEVRKNLEKEKFEKDYIQMRSSAPVTGKGTEKEITFEEKMGYDR